MEVFKINACLYTSKTIASMVLKFNLVTRATLNTKFKPHSLFIEQSARTNGKLVLIDWFQVSDQNLMSIKRKVFIVFNFIVN